MRTESSLENGVMVALDVGATGIKVVTARITDGALAITDVKSVPTTPRREKGCAYVDVEAILDALLERLSALMEAGEHVLSAGIDTFGNGYGFLDEAGQLICLPYDYRDTRVERVMEQVHRHFSERELYMRTGNFPFRTRGLFHLYEDVLEGSENIRRGRVMLPLPNLLEYLLTGERRAERTICSVLYMLDETGRDWNYPVFERLGIPTQPLLPVSEPGQAAGEIRFHCPQQIAQARIPLVNVIGHDTESALLMAPEMDEESAFVCMGTSFIFGTRLERPLISEQTYRFRFKNMQGAFGQVSLCKDFPGFWLLEQCIGSWSRGAKEQAGKDGPSLSYEALNEACEAAASGQAFLDINDERFRIADRDILEKIADYCTETGQTAPGSVGQTVRCLYESYCCFLRWNLEALAVITGKRAKAMYVFNGGTKNIYLMQMLSDMIRMPVITCGRCASAGGNLLMQRAYLTGETDRGAMTEAARKLAERRIFRPDRSKATASEKLYHGFLRIKPLEIQSNT